MVDVQTSEGVLTLSSGFAGNIANALFKALEDANDEDKQLFVFHLIRDAELVHQTEPHETMKNYLTDLALKSDSSGDLWEEMKDFLIGNTEFIGLSELLKVIQGHEYIWELDQCLELVEALAANSSIISDEEIDGQTDILSACVDEISCWRGSVVGVSKDEDYLSTFRKIWELLYDEDREDEVFDFMEDENPHIAEAAKVFVANQAVVVV